MSGIAGIFRRDGRPASPDAIARMSGAIAHRGRDASGVFCEGVIALAQRMNWSTPESTYERQPIVRMERASCLVADARLDNRADLIRMLRVADAASATDADIVLLAYERWGTCCVEHLIGDFAFAIWDGRSGELFCARDPMGVKPLYFYQSDGLFAFASEVRALLALPEVPREIDPRQVALFIDGADRDRCHTHYKSIRRLPSAHSMTVGRRSVTLTPYWRLDPERELHYPRSRDYADEFRALFTEAVKARLRTVHPVGAALSGGLDSSSIVCVASQLSGDEHSAALHSFSLVFPSLQGRDLALIDERRHIDSVVRAARSAPCYVRGDELSPVADIDQILPHLDEPFAAPNLYLHLAMYRAAAARGALVFLDGFDGDSVVSHGFGRFNGLVERGEWDVFERELRTLAVRRQVAPESLLSYFGLPHLAGLARRGEWMRWARTAGQLARRFDVPVGDMALNHGLRPALPSRVRRAYRAMRGARIESASLLLPSVARALLAGGDPVSPYTDDPMRSERALHIEGISQPAYQRTLELADQCSAALGVEPRYPFFDRRLVEFCLAVPDAEKLADGWPRLVFRRAMDGILPAEVQWRSDKGNLSPSFHRSLRASPAMTAERRSDSPLAEFVNIGALEEMRKRYCAEQSTLGRSADGHVLFRMLVLERWLLQIRGNSTVEESAVSATKTAAA
ncbi:MAG TPA: lasso peptide isopeptide bond-forming cyclase [Gemmatimonadaceae bacterium]|nr:lasso peptide isopeptide bond-forming cyclase [Gemmatimonadaceae bacterium]